MEIKILRCPGCGAPLKKDPDSSMAKCEFCGQEVLVDDGSAERRHLEEMAYAREKARYEAQIAQERREKRERQHHPMLFLYAVLLAIGVVLGLARVAVSPKCDPFACATVEFSGVNGEGRAEIVKKGGGGIDTNEIDYRLSADRDLSEGDVVTLTADSDKYRLTSRSKQFKVTGLEQYLTELDSLSDEVLGLIHQKSAEICDSNLHGAVGLSEANEILSREPCCMYLATDGKNRNILYDVARLVVSTYEGGEKTVYITAYYNNIIVLDGEEKSFHYDRCMYRGNQIWLGENTLRNGLIEGFESPESAELDLRTRMESGMKILSRQF